MAEANTINRLALQIRLLREKSNLTQTELGEKIGMGQSAIARLESPSYGKYSIATLNKISSFFDVDLWVEFTSFSTMLRRTENLSPEALTPKCYLEEFAENGEPLAETSLIFDESVICLSNYVTHQDNYRLEVVIPPNTEVFFNEPGIEYVHNN